MGTLAAGKQDTISAENPLSSIELISGLESELSAAAASVVGISGVTGLEDALAGKQSVIGPESSLQCETLTCSLLKAVGLQNSIRLSDSANAVLLELRPDSSTFLTPVSVPSLESTGSSLCSSSAVIGGPLYVAGGDEVALIGTKKNTITDGSLSFSHVSGLNGVLSSK